MKRTDNAKAYRERLLGDRVSSLAETDPEYIERFENFAFDEVIHQGDLDERTRMMAILAALLGCPGIDAFEGMVEGALNLGVTPVEIKEIIYQGTAYLGFGKVLPLSLIHICNVGTFIFSLIGEKMKIIRRQLCNGVIIKRCDCNQIHAVDTCQSGQTDRRFMETAG